MNSLPRIYVDFNGTSGRLPDGRAWIWLTFRGTKMDLEALGLVLEAGMKVRLYQPDDCDEDGKLDSLEVDAVIEWNDEIKCLVAVFVWDDLDYMSKKNRRKSRETN